MITINMFSTIILGIIIIISHYLMNKFTDKTLRKIFILILISTFVLIFCEGTSDIIETTPGQFVHNTMFILNFIFMVFQPLLYYSVLMMIYYSIKKDRVVLKRLIYLTIFAEIVVFILLLFNINSGFYYYIDENNVYQRGTMLAVRLAISYVPALMALILLFVNFKYMRNYDRMLFLIFAIPCTAATAVDLLVDGAGLTFPITFCAELFAYLFIINKDTEEERYKRELAELSSKQKSEFLANMSHEIRTPMNAIIGLSEMMLRNNLDGETKDNAMSIKQASTNLLSIINDILDISKIEAGKIELHDTEYELATIINEVNSITTVNLEKKMLNLIFMLHRMFLAFCLVMMLDFVRFCLIF